MNGRYLLEYPPPRSPPPRSPPTPFLPPSPVSLEMSTNSSRVRLGPASANIGLIPLDFEMGSTKGGPVSM